MKEDKFLKQIQRHIAPLSQPIMNESEPGIIYIGAGYYRMKLYRKDNLVIGVRLINPDLSAEELQTIELAIATMMHVTWTRNPTDEELDT